MAYEFDSRSEHYAPLAQLEVQRPSKPWVESSSLSWCIYSGVAQRLEQWSYKPLVVSSILTFAIHG